MTVLQKVAAAAAKTARNDTATGVFRWLVGILGTLGATGVGALVAMVISHNGALVGIGSQLTAINNQLASISMMLGNTATQIGSVQTKDATQDQQLVDIDRRLDSADTSRAEMWRAIGNHNQGTNR